jgi:hypothetical protein
LEAVIAAAAGLSSSAANGLLPQTSPVNGLVPTD